MREEFESFRNHDRQHPYIRRLIRYGNDKQRALEFGSGRGVMSLALKREHPLVETHLLDFSQTAVDYSRKLFAHYNVDGKFHCGSFLEMPYRDGYFDFIHGNTVLEHVEDPVRAVKELTRVLAPGGMGIITVPNSYRRFDGHDMYHVINNIQYFSRTFYPRELEALFESNSCEVVDRFGSIAVFFYPSYPFQYVYRVARNFFEQKRKAAVPQVNTEDDDIIVTREIGRKISLPRRIMRLWGYGQSRFNVFMEHHDLLPYPWWIVIGIVVKKNK